jgi:uncharacterized protein (TIGR00266 family)
MQTEIVYGPGAAAARIKLAPREMIFAEAGAMIAMSGDTNIQTTARQRSGGSLLGSAKRLLGGESFFLNQFTAGGSGGEVLLATTLAGDMMEYELKGETLIVQGGSWVASEPSVTVDVGWHGFKTLFAGEGLFWLQLKGSGKTILSSFGAIYPIEIDGETIVDSGHIVAFNETLQFSLTKAGSSWVSSILGGEGLVCRFTGRGTVWCQSHNPMNYGRILGPMLRPRG